MVEKEEKNVKYVTSKSDVQVNTKLAQRDFYGQSLLMEAASTGDKATFEAVWTILCTRLSTEQVRYRLFDGIVAYSNIRGCLKVGCAHNVVRFFIAG